ncbi:MAG TPA: hypothetical protein VF388_09245, partial [Lacunisphaera sp.]
IFVVPFGAAGLLLATGLAAGASFAGMAKLMQHFGLPAWGAMALAAFFALTPLSLHTYYDETYGFHIDLLEPALCVWLVYFLFRKSWRSSILSAAALLAIKEDAPLLVAVSATVVLVEDGLGRRGLNRVALAALGGAILALPLLLCLIRSQASDPGAVDGFQRLRLVEAGTIDGPVSLLAFGFGHLRGWLSSAAVGQWFGVAAAATCGFIFLRPHLLVIGLPTTLVAWLMQDSIFWAPRSAPALAFFQVLACLGAVSAVRYLGTLSPALRPLATKGCALGLSLAMILAVVAQLRALPRAAQIYQLSPQLPVTAAERQDAEAVFAPYRKEAKSNEPVIASLPLFRFARYDNLYWPHRLKDLHSVKWILWDRQSEAVGDLRTALNHQGKDLSDFRLVASRGRFAAYRLREPSDPAESATGHPDSTAYGALRLRIQLPGTPGVRPEPLAVLGKPGAAMLAYIRPEAGGRFVVGLEFWSVGTIESAPVTIDPATGGVADLVIAAPVLFPAAGDPRWSSTTPARQQSLLSRVTVTWNNQTILDQPAPVYPMDPIDLTWGENPVGGSFVGSKFSGRILQTGREPPAAR